MAISPALQATLDRYLASFTPDVSDQRERLAKIIDELHTIRDDYVAALNELERLAGGLQSSVDTIKANVSDALNPAIDDTVSREDILEALSDVTERVTEYGHEVDEAFMVMVPVADRNGQLALDHVVEDLRTINDELADAARALDEHADRIGRVA